MDIHFYLWIINGYPLISMDSWFAPGMYDNPGCFAGAIQVPRVVSEPGFLDFQISRCSILIFLFALASKTGRWLALALALALKQPSCRATRIWHGQAWRHIEHDTLASRANVAIANKYAASHGL